MFEYLSFLCDYIFLSSQKIFLCEQKVKMSNFKMKKALFKAHMHSNHTLQYRGFEAVKPEWSALQYVLLASKQCPPALNRPSRHDE